MQTMTANQAKQNFGELLDKAQRGPVAITRHGRRVAVFLSGEDYDLSQKQKQAFLDEHLAESYADLKAGRTVPGEQVFQEIRDKYDLD